MKTGDAQVGMLFWLTVLIFACISLASVALGLSTRQGNSESGKSLHADLAVSKLNTDSGDPDEDRNPVPQPVGQEADLVAKARPDDPPVVPPVQKEPDPVSRSKQDQSSVPQPVEPATEPTVTLWMPPASAPLKIEPMELIPLPLVEEVVESNPDPAIYLPRRAARLGDTPMIRTWKTLAIAALLAAAAPPMASAGGAAGDADLKKSIEELSKKLDALTKKVDAASFLSVTEVADLKVKLAQMETEQLRQKMELQGLRDKPAAATDKALLDRLSAIEKALAALDAAGRKSYSPPISGSAGRVLLVNLYSEEMLFIVNKLPYRVEPNRTMQLDGVGAGSVTYEVFSPTWGMRASRTTLLNPNETLTLTAR
jgi:hypothetical protein